jgi:hypothetical protein
MDALGVPLEGATASEVTGVIAPSGWSPGRHMKGAVSAGDPPDADSLATRFGVIRYALRAVKLDKAWTKGSPDRWPAVGEYLRRRTGHSFPVLSRLRNRRAIRAIATMIEENLSESVIGLDDKLAAGLLYAHTIGNPTLAEELRARHQGAARLADADPGARDLIQPSRGGSERARVVSGNPAGGDRRTGIVRFGSADAAPALELLPSDRLRVSGERVGQSTTMSQSPGPTCPYSPECVEGEFLELLRPARVLRSSAQRRFYAAGFLM